MTLLDLLYNSERIFKYRLERNPYYPFTEVKPKVFVLHVDSIVYIFKLVFVFTLAAAYVAIVVAYSWSLQLILIPCVGLAIVLPFILRDRHKRTLVYDGNTLVYEYYIDGDLVHQDHCHNLYVRVKVETGGTEESHFYSVVINGFGMREHALTKLSRRREKLYRMGRRLAYNLNLNFFDCVDRSSNHAIRHYGPGSEKRVFQNEVHKGV